jgi:hypothetical protein
MPISSFAELGQECQALMCLKAFDWLWHKKGYCVRCWIGIATRGCLSRSSAS